MNEVKSKAEDIKKEKDRQSKMNVMFLRTPSQVAVWEHEIKGQLSDGMWENLGGPHWEFWCDTKAVVGKPGFIHKTGRCIKTGYALTGEELLSCVGDRMVSYAKMATLTSNYDYIEAAEYVDEYKTYNEFLNRQPLDYKEAKLSKVPNVLARKFFDVKYDMNDLKKDLREIKKAMKLAKDCR